MVVAVPSLLSESSSGERAEVRRTTGRRREPNALPPSPGDTVQSDHPVHPNDARSTQSYKEQM